MQQIERYGVIVLVFFLVTIVAVSFWGDSKSPGFWARLTGKGQPKKEQNDKVATTALTDQHVVDPNAPLSPATTPIPPVAVPLPIDGNVNPTQQVPYTPGPTVAGGTPPANNPFMPNATPNGGANNIVPVANTSVAQPATHANAPKSATNKYVVQKGDSLASIARHELGAESRWTEIQSLNDGVTPKNLRVGQTIMLPAGGATKSDTTVAAIPHKTAAAMTTDSKKAADKKVATPAVKTASKTSGTGYYTVKKGDGLRAIAREQLGDESRWKEIVAANPGLKADNIHAGDKLRLPSGSTHSTSNGDALASMHVASTSDEPRVR